MNYKQWYNNRHWFTDVVAGAGIGILSAKAGYWLYPTINKLLASKKKISLILEVKPLDCCDHDVPPVTDFKILPLAVVAHAVFTSKKKIERKLSVIPLDCSTQVVPPSLVNIIFPEAPTATPFKVFTAVLYLDYFNKRIHEL